MALYRRRRSHDPVPHIPFYKDEKVLGKRVTLSVSLRALLVAIILFALAVGITLFQVIDANSALHNYVVQARAARVADQARMNAEVDELACYLVASVPDDPKTPIIKKFRDRYHCPPYGKDPNFKLYPKPKPKSAMKATPKVTPGGSGGSSGEVTYTPHAYTPHVVPSPLSRPTALAPRATPRQAIPSPPQSGGKPPILDVPKLITVGGTGCQLKIAGICIAK